MKAIAVGGGPPPIRTFGDLENALDELEGPIIPDLEMVERVLRERRKPTPLLFKKHELCFLNLPWGWRASVFP